MHYDLNGNACKGPSFPQAKADGMFESISRKPNGQFVRVRHDRRDKAEARLRGVASRHQVWPVVDHTPRKD